MPRRLSWCLALTLLLTLLAQPGAARGQAPPSIEPPSLVQTLMETFPSLAGQLSPQAKIAPDTRFLDGRVVKVSRRCQPARRRLV